MTTLEEMRQYKEKQRTVDAAVDTDGDGFTDLEEKDGHFDPTDSKHHPPYSSRLSIVSVSNITRTISFWPLEIPHAVPTKARLSVQDDDQKTKNYLIPIGSSVERLRAISLHGTTVTFQHGDQKHVLSYGDTLSLTNRTAHLLLDLFRSRKRLGVQEGEILRLRDTEYKVVSIDTGKPTIMLSDMTGTDTTLIKKMQNQLLHRTQ